MAELIPLQKYRRQLLKITDKNPHILYEVPEGVYALGLQIQITNMSVEPFSATSGEPTNIANVSVYQNTLLSPNDYFYITNYQTIYPEDSGSPYVKGRDVYEVGDKIFVQQTTNTQLHVKMSILELAIG